MFRKRNLQFVGILFSVFLMLAGDASAARRVISLDGEWKIAQGKMEQVPALFPAEVPVPGMADMATPAFSEVGVKSAQRQAFWYRRTFTTPGGKADLSLLKIHKAKFGKKVFLNGKLVGEHFPNFTPVTFDISKYLKPAREENELIIRIGADNTTVAQGRAFGWDKEKIRFIPGIYDSIELILTGKPYIVNVQTVPNLERKSVRAVVELGKGIARASGSMHAKVVEVRSGKIVGSRDNLSFILDADGQAKLDFQVPISNCRFWSPEDPFLYRLELDCGADTYSTRFGMRTFRFDAKSRLAKLNEKTYFLRGTNIAIFRFMEDSQRGDKIWCEEWVRRLFKKMKEMNWNSFRFTLGFPPEFWYDIADEEGILIQDEYPIWDGIPSLKNMTIEFTEWMRERWNHPSVVIWDAQNETQTEATSATIRAVRGLDLSDRPWDNGRGSTGRITDCWETHPYMYINHIYHEMYPGPLFRISCLEKAPKRPWKYANEGQIPAAQIINEYGWLWLNRDGSPTWLTDNLYRNILGANSTTEQRRLYYAQSLAALTEYWRSRRTCAGIQHFSFLTHSRPTGKRSATSDAFIDVEKVKVEPFFESYVSDAFSPIGVCIDFWKEELQKQGQSVKIPVILLNDLYDTWKGTLTLSLLCGEKTVWTKTVPATLAGLEKKECSFQLPFPEGEDSYQLIARLDKVNGHSVRSVRNIRMIRGNMALNCSATASTGQNLGAQYSAKNAVDGNPQTRWSSAFSDPQWLQVDLGAIHSVNGVELDWETAFGKSYEIEVSENGRDFHRVYRTDTGKGGVETIAIPPQAARYIRLRGLKRGTEYGYSLWEFKIFGK